MACLSGAAALIGLLKLRGWTTSSLGIALSRLGTTGDSGVSYDAINRLWTVMAGGVVVASACRDELTPNSCSIFLARRTRQTVERLKPLVPAERQIIVTGSILGQAIRDALPELPAANILEEPTGRNTAPAIGWAAQHVLALDPDATLAILPADQFIADETRYREVVLNAVEAAQRGGRIDAGHPTTRDGVRLYLSEKLSEGGRSVQAFKSTPGAAMPRSWRLS